MSRAAWDYARLVNANCKYDGLGTQTPHLDAMSAPNCPEPLTARAIAERADALLPQYREAISGIPPEAGFGGIWESEMFLFYAAVYPCAPKQILESGRARGKSTVMLARCFPNARIISVEYDAYSPNAAAAEEKLRPYPKVELLYGDSRGVLPARLAFADAVLIDGPKEFRALELALRLLRSEKPCAVFIHDFPRGTTWRRFVERHWPNAFFGDDPLFERFKELDEGRDPRDVTGGSRHQYGIFACLPPRLPAGYWQLRVRLWLAEHVRIVL
jgi:predicted O-methyltransferase YrrM